MALLEQETDIPVNLAAKILARKDEIELPKVRRLNISNYIQIAAAILFGIFVGHKFGKIANTQTDKIKQDPTSQYFKAHHFNIDNADFNSPTKFLTN